MIIQRDHHNGVMLMNSGLQSVIGFIWILNECNTSRFHVGSRKKLFLLIRGLQLVILHSTITKTYINMDRILDIINEDEADLNTSSSETTGDYLPTVTPKQRSFTDTVHKQNRDNKALREKILRDKIANYKKSYTIQNSH